MSDSQYAVGLVLPEEPKYAQGYRYVVRSPGNIGIAYDQTEREAQPDVDSRDQRHHA